MHSTVMSTYARLPVGFTHGKGIYLYDDEGNEYIDALSGIAVNCLGHAHPRMVESLSDQVGKLMHVSNLYQITEQESLAARLTGLAGMDNAFFCNSGAEANEAAIKLARRYGHQLGHAVPKILVAEGSFHGRTMATLTATGNPRIQAGFEPLLEGFIHVPYSDLAALEQAAATHDDIVAILLEPIQGEGGINVPNSDYLLAVARLCSQHNWLMMLDEVQTGIGRSGKWFAFQHHNIQPDVITLAKGLGGGFPIGACLARGNAADVLVPGSHGSTFGGNPFACRAALTVLDVIYDDALCGQAAEVGDFLRKTIEERLSGQAIFKEARGQGLMIGIELNNSCAELVELAIKREQLLLNVTASNVVRLLPPLITDHNQAQIIADKVVALVESL